MKVEECPWCKVPVVKEKEEDGIIYYRCPKCKHGFVSRMFSVPVKNHVDKKGVLLFIGDKKGE